MLNKVEKILTQKPMNRYDLNLDSRFYFAYETTKSFFQNNSEIKNVFDIGSGSELMRDKIESLGLNYYSFDLFPPNETVRKWNIEEPFPYNEKADIVIFLEVVEHLNNPLLSLQNISKLITKGGCLILSSPNPSWSGSRLSLLRNGYLDMFKVKDLEINHHVFTAWQHIVVYFLKECNFSQIKINTLGKKTSVTAFPFWGIKMPFRLFYRGIKILIEKKDSTAIGALYGIVAIKEN